MALTLTKSSLKPSIELLTASALWGFSFVTTVWALEQLSFQAIVFYRFFIAFLVGLVVLFFKKTSQSIIKHELKIAFPAGFFLGITLLLQTWGLLSISASESAFITVLYVVIVPLIERLILRRPLVKKHWLAVCLALMGVYLITGAKVQTFSLGHWLTLANAIFASFHILSVDFAAKKSSHPFIFNTFQSFWTALVALIFSGSLSRWSLHELSYLTASSILFLGLGSSLLAFYLQVLAQKRLSASIASVLFLMESPFTVFFAFIFLNERLNLSQMIGAVMIFTSCGLAIQARPSSRDQF